MPLSGYNIIFQCRTDYFSMEGKWLGENPSTNPKWHDSGLKEPACFLFLLLHLHFHSPLREKSNNWKLTAPNRLPYLIQCFDICSRCYSEPWKGWNLCRHIAFPQVFCRYTGMSVWVSLAVASTKELSSPLTCFIQICQPFWLQIITSDSQDAETASFSKWSYSIGSKP